jgi:hypothetical protein
MAKDTAYVSETTKFINTYLEEHPGMIKKQQELRSTWWDTNGIDQAEQNEYKRGNVPLDEYAYFSYHMSKHNTQQSSK